MRADEVLRGLAHRVNIKRAADAPRMAQVVDQRCAAHDDPVEVSAFGGREARVPVIPDGHASGHGYGMGFQMMVQRFGQAERLPFARHVAMGHLTQRVNAGVGAPGGRDGRHIGVEP